MDADRLRTLALVASLLLGAGLVAGILAVSASNLFMLGPGDVQLLGMSGLEAWRLFVWAALVLTVGSLVAVAVYVNYAFGPRRRANDATK